MGNLGFVETGHRLLRPQFLGCILGLVVASTCFTVSVAGKVEVQQVATPAQVTFFETKIRPVLAENCFSCHGESVQMANLRLDTAEHYQKGNLGGQSDNKLLRAIQYTSKVKMPPSGRLGDSQIQDIEAWIKMGSPWPSKTTNSPKSSGLWSLKPLSVQPPKLTSPSPWAKTPIDQYVAVHLEKQKLKPSSSASKATLLRRLHFDLIGLPPTYHDMTRFMADKSEVAIAKEVDRLLTLPQFGEKWGRHWLDVARYADTKGYVFEEDRLYPHAYTYREWVINAYNTDLPFDEFIKHQLAADLMEKVRGSEDKRPLAALGFLTVGRRFINNQPDIIDDRIDATMRGFQAFTVACARCHDHKFDPIPTEDYYSLYGVFASTQDQDAPISERSVRDPWTEYQKRISVFEQLRIKQVKDQVAILRKQVQSNPSSLTQEVKDTLQQLREEQVPEGNALAKLRKAFEPEANAKLSQNESEIESLRKAQPKVPEFAMAVADRENPHDSDIFVRGNVNNRGNKAPRRFLAALTPAGTDRQLWKAGSGRMQLAESISSPTNPLTARVAVNRIWQTLFGRGIVTTASDFGNQGDKPTHPELLDYLASRFIEKGWSTKKLIREIVLSATYQRDSTMTAKQFDADPDNRYLSRMNRKRLDLEQMRDSVVSVAGSLDTKTIGGKSVDLWSAPFSNRRAVYGFVERQNLPGIFRTFDFASPDVSSSKRFQTTVPQQALFFMNSPFLVTQSQSLISRDAVSKSSTDSDRITNLYRILFARTPTQEELTAGQGFLKGNSLKEVDAPSDLWKFGFGSLSLERGTVSDFRELSHFKEGGYRYSNQFPDPIMSYLLLTSLGGHPGKDINHATVIQWTSPIDGIINISGTLQLPNPEGDGVRASVLTSSDRVLGTWNAMKSSTSTAISSVAVKKGERLFFGVDPRTNDGFDAYGWEFEIKTLDGKSTWTPKSSFGVTRSVKLNRLALYVQALMMTNEFYFVD